MSIDPSLAIQKAIFAALLNNTAAGGNVFDRVSAANPFPRITHGSIVVNDWPYGCMAGSECFIDVDVWSREPGYPQVKTIADQVREILDDADLTLEGHHLELLSYRDSAVSRDPDGLTNRARMTFYALTQPA